MVPRLRGVCWGHREAPAGCRALAQQLLGSLLTPPSSPAPQIAAKVAAPLSKVDEIVILSGESSNTVSEVNRLLAEIPASVRAITGVDLTKVSRAPALRLWGHAESPEACQAAGEPLLPQPHLPLTTSLLPPADSPDPESHRGPGVSPELVKIPPSSALRRRLPLTRGIPFLSKTISFVFKLWCLIL